MLYKEKYIGCNHTDLLRFGGINSSFNGTFKDEEVLIGSVMDYTPCIIGDISDAYLILKDEIYKIKPTNINELSECIFNTILVAACKACTSKLVNYNHDIDEINYGFEMGKVSDLKGKNAAMCVERAMLSQNLLTSLDINTYYKSSGINKEAVSVVCQHQPSNTPSSIKSIRFPSYLPTISIWRLSKNVFI